jgi:hypothetical protein
MLLRFRSLYFAVGWLGSMSACALSAADAQCVIELPVYDETGASVSFTVFGTALREARKSVDVLSASAGAFRGKAEGSLIYFPRVWIGREFEVTMRDKKGNSFKAEVPIVSCQQRTSLQFGEAEAAGDVGWSTIHGRVTGCKLDGDWWIRAMPMFGGNEFRPSFEGHINTSDGSFSMRASFRGERHVVVIGKSKHPVKAFALNLVKGGKNDAGVLDLRGVCPH